MIEDIPDYVLHQQEYEVVKQQEEASKALETLTLISDQTAQAMVRVVDAVIGSISRFMDQLVEILPPEPLTTMTPEPILMGSPQPKIEGVSKRSRKKR